ncbi:murein biosynthesis integral membrane protein MurJ [Candidatus Gracilibacteria bacterium]|nr:murein biosynthesis integral membrane protein MurJ [Candidatus Gracilibacteria bacterium]
MYKKILSSGVLLLAISSLVSRILGLLRDKIFAHQFGALQASSIFDLDAYYAAFRLPDFMFQLLIMGTVASAFVPIFSGYFHTEKKEQAWEFLDTCITCLTTLLLGLGGVIFIFAPWIVPLLVPGFSPEKTALTVHLTRIMLVSPIIFCISSLYQSVENAAKKYFYFALAPILYNLAIILATVFFAPTYGVIAIAYGVVIGAICHAAIQWPAVKKLGYKFQPRFNWKSKDFRQFIKLAMPRIFGIGVTQFNVLVDTIIASTLVTGSITSFNYAINLESLPLGLIGVSISIVAFGIFSEQVAKNDHEGMLKTLRQKLENIAVYIIPATAGMILLKEEIINVVLKGGKFTSDDVNLTASLLGILSLALLAQSIIPLCSRFFYAKRDTYTPVIIGLIGFGTNIIASLYFAKFLHWGVMGIAAGMVLSSVLQALLLLRAIKEKQHGTILTIEEIKKYKQIILATVVMSLGVWVLQQMTKLIPLSGMIISLIILLILGGAGVWIYFYSLKRLNFPDYRKYISTKISTL